MRACNASIPATAVAVLCVVLAPATLTAQSQPNGAGRVWLEVGVGGASQAQGCARCVRSTTIGGVEASAAAGMTFSRGLGVAVLLRGFQEITFDATQGSKYVLGLVQYTLPRVPYLTFNAGAGRGAHKGSPVEYANTGSGAVVSAGLALRLPARGRVALGLSSDLIQSISGTRESTDTRHSPYHPRLFTVGISLSMASAPR